MSLQAIDLVDEACSNMRVQLESMPEEMDLLQRQQYRLRVEEAALSREKDKVCLAADNATLQCEHFCNDTELF